MLDNKPNVSLYKEEVTEGQPPRSFDVYHIGGKINENHGATTRSALACTNCYRTHIYKWQTNDRWIIFSCPSCKAVSAHWEEIEQDEEDEE